MEDEPLFLYSADWRLFRMLLPPTTLQWQPWRRSGTRASLRRLREGIRWGWWFWGMARQCADAAAHPRALEEDTSLIPPPKFGIWHRANAACSGRREHLEIHHHRGRNSPSPQSGVISSPYFKKRGKKRKKKKRGKDFFNQIIYFLFQRKDLHYLLLFIYMYFTFVFKMHRSPNNFLVPALN